MLGLAIGFAVRDTLENYISSIMLSLRQPFRTNAHVIINEHVSEISVSESGEQSSNTRAPITDDQLDLNVNPESHIDEKINDERREQAKEDLLNPAAPEE